MVRRSLAALGDGRDRLAVLLYLPLAGLSAAYLIAQGHWWAPAALLPVLLGVWGIVVSTALLRIDFATLGASGDQPAVTAAALERVMAGLSPYGVAYAEGTSPNTPYPYGPLALLHTIPWEIAASIALAVLLAASRRPLTLALYAGVPFSVYLAANGNNDFTSTLLLAGGIVAMPRWWGGVLVGLAIAWKPYIAIFLPTLLPFGWLPFLAGSATALVGYLPLLWWGGFLQSMSMMLAMAGPSPLRLLAVPLALAGLRYGLIAGCVAFAVLVLGGGLWQPGHLIPLGVATGLALERPDLAGRLSLRRAQAGT
jgi:hypothetical protein